MSHECRNAKAGDNLFPVVLSKVRAGDSSSVEMKLCAGNTQLLSCS